MRSYSTLFFLTALASSALAQRVFISSPADGTTINACDNVTVEIVQPDSQGSVENVAITIGVAACTPYGGCPDATQQFGQIIYGAPYAPTYLSPGNATLGQNVTVQVPDAFKGGKVSLNVAHVALEGAASFPAVDIANITLNLA